MRSDFFLPCAVDGCRNEGAMLCAACVPRRDGLGLRMTSVLFCVEHEKRRAEIEHADGRWYCAPAGQKAPGA